MSILIKGMEMPKDGVYWCEIGVAGDIAVITIHGEDRRSFHLVPTDDMMDPIDRQAAIDEAVAYIEEWNNAKSKYHKKEITRRFQNLPSAQPKRKTGRWIYGEDDSGQDGWTCSECGFFVPWYYEYYGLNNTDFIRDFHTCPHCDAKMLTYTGKKMEVEHE